MVVAAKVLPKRRGGVYWLDKEPYDSVTTVLKGGLPAPGLEIWKQRTQYMKWCSDPEHFNTFERVQQSMRDDLDTAAGRGSTVHSLAEALDMGGAVDLSEVPEKFQGYARALTQFEQDVKPVTVHTEATVFNKTHRYAGTLDRICKFGGRTVLLDRKTSSGSYYDHALQVAAYAGGELLASKDFVPVLTPMPKIDATMILLLRSDGTYGLSEFKYPLSSFLRVLETYREQQAFRGSN